MCAAPTAMSNDNTQELHRNLVVVVDLIKSRVRQDGEGPIHIRQTLRRTKVVSDLKADQARRLH